MCLCSGLITQPSSRHAPFASMRKDHSTRLSSSSRVKIGRPARFITRSASSIPCQRTPASRPLLGSRPVHPSVDHRVICPLQTLDGARSCSTVPTTSCVAAQCPSSEPTRPRRRDAGQDCSPERRHQQRPLYTPFSLSVRPFDPPSAVQLSVHLMPVSRPLPVLQKPPPPPPPSCSCNFAADPRRRQRGNSARRDAKALRRGRRRFSSRARVVIDVRREEDQRRRRVARCWRLLTTVRRLALFARR